MADYTWTGATDGNLEEATNYDPNGLPTASDTLTIDPSTASITNNPSSGTSNAGTVNTDFSFGGVTIDGGTWTGAILDWGSLTINDGVFLGDLSDTTSGVTIYSGEFHGNVLCGGSINGGTFYGDVTANCPVTGDFYGDLLRQDASNMYTAPVIHHRMSLDGGSTWLYSPESPDVVYRGYVLTGTSNLGTAGTLTLPSTGEVKSGVSYGVAGTGSTGTMSVPAARLLVIGRQ